MSMQTQRVRGVLLGFLMGLAAAGASCEPWDDPLALCQSVAAGTPLSALPVLPYVPSREFGNAFAGPVDAIRCCLRCDERRSLDAGTPCECSVGCEAFEGIALRTLGGPYGGGCSDGFDRVACSVYALDGGVVAVTGWCTS